MKERPILFSGPMVRALASPPNVVLRQKTGHEVTDRLFAFDSIVIAAGLLQSVGRPVSPARLGVVLNHGADLEIPAGIKRRQMRIDDFKKRVSFDEFSGHISLLLRVRAIVA